MDNEKLTLRTPKPGKLDNVPVEQLRADRERMSVGYMARHYGVSRSTMYRALRKAGLVDGKQQES
jgi:transcriptional regulator of acetoin/glycerol metabolism